MLIVVVSVVPIAIELLRARRSRRSSMIDEGRRRPGGCLTVGTRTPDAVPVASRPARHRRRVILGLAVAGAVAACSAQRTRSTRTPGPITTVGASTAPPTVRPTTTAGPTTALPTAAGTGSTAGRSPAPPTPSLPAPGSPAVEVGHGSRSGSAVALTFHGSGSLALAEELLGLVDRAGAKVTVMAVGTWLAANPRVAGTVRGAGHELGNHTLHHLDMPRLSPSDVAREITGCRAVLERVTGSPQTWFRASATQHTNAVIRAAAGAAGYPRCLSYDVDGLDWQDPSPATVVDAVLGGVRPGSVVSLHLGHRVTVQALPAILTGLRRRGLQAVTCTTLLG